MSSGRPRYTREYRLYAGVRGREIPQAAAVAFVGAGESGRADPRTGWAVQQRR